MTDIRQVSQTATIYTGQVETANIVGNAPAASEIASGIPGALPVITQLNDVALNFTATNMGEENIPDPRLFKFLSDEFNLPEQVVRQVFKNLSDLSTTDEQVRKLLEKVLQDITTTSDVFNRVWTAYRTHTDSTANSELLKQDFQKVLEDVANAPDLLRTDVGKYLADVTALANLSYAVMLVGKDLQDQTIGFSDVLSTVVEFKRTFEDTAFMSDDFYGSANIDDDQYAQVFKVVLEWISLPETFAVDLDRPGVEDQAILGEQAYLNPQIPKSDQAAASDLRTAHPQPSKLDQITNTEQQLFVINKPDRADQASTIEQQAFDVTKPDRLDEFTNTDVVANTVNKIRSDEFTSQNELYSFDVSKPDRADQAITAEQVAKAVTTSADSDQVSISELLLTKLIGLNINEIDYFLEDYVFDITDYTFKAVHARDQIKHAVAKQFSELVDATDDFYGAANVDDDQIASFDKVVADRVNFSEAFDRLVSYIRLFTETAQMLEEVKILTRKNVLEQVDTPEVVALRTGKRILEEALTVETQIFDLDKTGVLDQATPSEQTYLATVKPLTDSVNNTDEFSRFYQAVRIFSELTQTSERVQQLVERVSTDQAGFTHLVTRAVQKIALDQTTNSEQQTFDFEAVYSDLVDATDDFYGAANVDDDQIAAIDKVLAEYASISETVTTVAEFYRTFLEVAASTDSATFDFAKSVVDVATLTERFAVDFSTGRTEVASVLETAAKNFSTQRTETVTQTDLFTQSIQPAKYETIATAEVVVYAAELQKSETATTAETVAHDFTTTRSDVANILELFITQWDALRSYSDAVSQTDLVKLTPGKVVSETTTNSEQQTFSTNKRPLDVATTTEVVAKTTTTEFSELIDATDDFYGAANIDDDQYATINKVVADYATNAETITTLTDFKRSVNESQILSEVFAAVTNKALSDITNSSDTVTLLTAQTKLESVTTSQTISLTLQSYFSQDYVELGYTGETYTY